MTTPKPDTPPPKPPVVCTGDFPYERLKKVLDEHLAQQAQRPAA